jgi:hypothetical protein
MGMDVYGVAPVITGTRPERPQNWSDLSDEEREAYWTSVDEWEQQNPGYYFRNNVWHWRVLVAIIDHVNESLHIGITADEMHVLNYNDGQGISDPEKCLKLAQGIQRIVDRMTKEGVENVHLGIGFWHYKSVDEDGNIINKTVDNKAVVEALGKQSDGLMFQLPTINGVEYFTSHSTDIDNLKDFIVFLQNCNGFEVH